MGIETDDIKKIEQQLLELEDYIGDIWQLLPVPIAYLSPLGVVLDADSALEELLNYSKEEIIGSNWIDHFCHRDKIIGIQEWTLEKGPVTSEECSIRSKEGKEIPVCISTLPRKDAEGNPIGYFAALIDVSERKRAEEKIQRHTKRLEALHAVAQTASQSLTLDELLNDALAKVLEVVDLDAGVIYFLDTETREIVLKAHRGVSEEFVGAMGRIKVAEADIQRWLEQREPTFGLQRMLDATTLAGIGAIIETEGMQSYVGTSLWSKDMLRGVMVLGGRSKRWFSPEELELLDATTNQIAVAIENAELFDQTRARAEELRDSEQRLRALIENAPDAIWVHDLKAKFIDGNKAAEELVGYSKEELIGRSFLEIGLLPEEYVSKAAAALEKSIKGEPVGPEEYQLIRKDGSRVSVEITTIPVEREGEVEVIGIARDITERKRAEEALHESEEKYRHLFQDLTDAAFVADVETGLILETNLQGEALLGKSRHEIVGMHQRQLHPSDKADEYGRRFAEHIEKGHAADYDGEVIKKDGTIVQVRISASPLTIGGQHLILGLFRDITERKRAEEALRESEELSRGMLESAATGIYIVQDGKFQYVSPLFEQISGYTSDELIGTYSLDYVYLEDREAVRKNAVKNLKGQSSSPHEFRFMRKDGEPVWILEKVASIQYKGERAAVGSFLDITERKKAEEELTVRHWAVASSVNAIALADLEGNLIYVNHSFLKLWGYGNEKEILGKSVIEFWQVGEQAAAVVSALYEKGSWQGELVGLRKDGSVFDVQLSASMVTDGDGKPICMMSSFIDVTERKRAEEKLRQSEEKLRRMFESITDGIAVTDLNGAIVEVNQRALEMHGFSSADEVLGKSAFEFIAQRDRERAIGKIGKTPEQGSVKGIEYSLIKADGSEFPGELSASVLKDASGSPVGFIAIMRDISERKRAEEALRESGELSRGMLESAATGIYIVQDGKFQYVSPLFEQISGYTSDELIGTYSLDYVHPEDREAVRQNAVKNLKGESSSPYEFRYIRKDDELVWVLEKVASIRYRGKQGAVASFLDITERKRAEEENQKLQDQLIRAQKMEALGRLAGGVAHDFNNLLTAISGYSEMMMSRLPQDDPFHEDLEQVVHAARHAAALTMRLLAFSRQQVLQPKVLDLNAVVADTEKMLQRIISEDIELITVLAEEPGYVKADPVQINQVIMNLVVNASDAMPQGGEVTIKVEKMTFDQHDCKLVPERRPGKFVCLSIADTGVGIDKAIVDRIFDPFFTTKEPEYGTGLGLSTVYGIVQQHEGWITVYSEPGHGAMFRVYLPTFSVKAEEDEKEERIELEGLRGNGERILLAEDEELVRKFAVRALVENGYVVFEASSAEEALDIFVRENGNFHLVFSDVVLPDEDGLELVDQLLGHKPGLPILLCSGYADRKSRWRAIHERGFRFLQKPYALADLLQTIKELIEAGSH